MKYLPFCSLPCSLLCSLLCLLGCTPAPTNTQGREPSFPFLTSSGIEMTFLPGGEFMMGSDRGEPDESPLHKVTLTPFAMDRTEVTHAMFTKMELPNPSKWQDDPNFPVNQVRWRDAKAFCNERSLAEGLEPCYDEQVKGWPCDFTKNGYRLPTEAEWEFAARAGANHDFPADSESKLATHAWFADNSGGTAHSVASRKPNAWGIFGLYGNVSEWCQDVYQADYYASSPAIDPVGPTSEQPGAKRVVRGGSWKATANMCRASFRQGKTTGDSDACFASDDCGFRCVRNITKSEAEQMAGPSAL